MSAPNKWTPETLANDLATAAVGQWVDISASNYEPSRMMVITHATKTKIVVDGMDFNRNGGRKGDHSYGRAYIYATTPERAAKISEERFKFSAARHLSDLAWSKLTTDELRAVMAVVPNLEGRK